MKLNVKRWGSLALSLLMATQTVGIASAFAAETDQSQQLAILEKVDSRGRGRGYFQPAGAGKDHLPGPELRYQPEPRKLHPGYRR